MRATLAATLIAASTAAFAPAAGAFCGFFVGKADASLFNEASQVLMVRDGDKTILTMLNDYKGELTDFALVVPVPVVLKREDIRVADKKVFDRIDAYSAPRLAEYHDGNPCDYRRYRMAESSPRSPSTSGDTRRGDPALGVQVEAKYTVGEYDIVILSASQSDGLETWLTQNGYKIPAGASRALRPYIQQNMKFFVARVNLKEQAKSGVSYLRPLQFRFESARFMLPIRLGMINAQGPQDLIVYVLSRRGRVEAANYRTVKLPANMELPTWLKQPGEFTKFYRAMFDQQAKRENHSVVFTEYFWDMAWCDPCAADPLTTSELREAGVSWVADDGGRKMPTLWSESVVFLMLRKMFGNREIFSSTLLEHWDHASSRDVQLLSGSCMMFRREVLGKLGGMDEGFFMYGEDMDFCHRMMKVGWKLRYFAEAEVMHHGSRSTSKAGLSMNVEGTRSMKRFFTKHRGMWYALEYLALLGAWSVLNLLYDTIFLLFESQKQSERKERIVARSMILRWLIQGAR